MDIDIMDLLYMICVAVVIISCLNIVVLLFFGRKKYLHEMAKHRGEHLLFVTAHPDDESMYRSCDTL